MNALKAIAAAIVLLSAGTVFNTFLLNRESSGKNVFLTEYIGRGTVLQFPLMSERVKQPCCKWDEDILGKDIFSTIVKFAVLNFSLLLKLVHQLNFRGGEGVGLWG